MIHTVTNNRYLKYKTPLIEYIKNNNLYNGENLIYTNKYTDGTFSITNPTSEYKNCDFVNGYPHFKIPLEICLEEIYYFINNQKLYDYQFNIRYGDTHPHKPIPKLAQVRNLVIENSLSSLIGDNVTSYYGFGDISIKSLNDFLNKNNINVPSEELFKLVVNNGLSDELKNKLLAYNKESLFKIKEFLKHINLPINEFKIESSLYTNQELYQKLKTDQKYKDELKENGELKYSLQELMFIYSLAKNENNILINIIGANQSDHVLKVNEILRNSTPYINCRFLTYEICRNAEERDYSKWINYFEQFIETNNLNINGKKITSDELLKIIVTIVSNDNILDFKNLNKYLKGVKVFCEEVNKCNKFSNINNIGFNNNLLCKMALVCYNLNRSIEKGEQNYFYKYVLSIIQEYEMNKEKYQGIEKLYYDFIRTCFIRLGFSNLVDKERCKVLIK